MTSCRNISNLRICAAVNSEFAAIEKYVPFVVLVLVEDVSHREVDKEEIYLYLLHVLQNPQSVFL